MADIPILYKCRCMAAEATVQCPARLPDEAIQDWMGVMRAAVTIDHRRRNPTCAATTMEYAKIAYHGDERPMGAPLNG